MIFEVSIIDIVLDLLITAVSYLLVPIIVIISGKKYCLKKLKKINVINCGVIWLLFRVIEAGLGNEPTSGLSVFLWGGIGYSLLKKNCLIEETSAYSPLSVNDASDDKVRMQKCSSRKHKKYCSYCGNLIDNDTKKCVWCGRQYFNGVRLKKLSMIVLSIFLVISLIGAFMLYRMNLDAQNEIERLKTTNDSLKSAVSKLQYEVNILTDEKEKYYDYWVDCQNEIDFYDEFVVFVEDDGTNLYHKYDCKNFVGEFFWAFNVDAASDNGYVPCSDCIS